MFAAGYVRGGVNTEDAAEFWTQFKDLSDCGKVPFVLAADWNATPNEVRPKDGAPKLGVFYPQLEWLHAQPER